MCSPFEFDLALWRVRWRYSIGQWNDMRRDIRQRAHSTQCLPPRCSELISDIFTAFDFSKKQSLPEIQRCIARKGFFESVRFKFTPEVFFWLGYRTYIGSDYTKMPLFSTYNVVSINHFPEWWHYLIAFIPQFWGLYYKKSESWSFGPTQISKPQL